MKIEGEQPKGSPKEEISQVNKTSIGRASGETLNGAEGASLQIGAGVTLRQKDRVRLKVMAIAPLLLIFCYRLYRGQTIGLTYFYREG